MTALGQTQLHWADVLIIVAYLLTVLTIGIWASCKGRKHDAADYFLGGRIANFLLVGFSLFGSNIGSEHFIGLAGSGAAAGIAVAGFELQVSANRFLSFFDLLFYPFIDFLSIFYHYVFSAAFVLVMLGWLFVPVYIASGVFTMPEYLFKRFGGQRIRVYMSCLALVLYVFTKISVDLFSGSIFIRQALNWNLYGAIGALLFVACLFTVAGGLTAVMWTDLIQITIMIAGAAALSGIAFARVGGFTALTYDYFYAVANGTLLNSTCGVPRADAMRLLQDPFSGDLPWTGMTFGLMISATWYWCTDQVIVQRVLASKNFTHAKGGCVLAGWFKMLPLWLIVFPGMAARILFPDKVACSTADSCEQVCGSRHGCSNIAYPLLVVELMPPGARGLMLAVMMSALMGSLTALFNSASTIFTIDIWLRLRTKASQLEQLLVGKIFVIILVAISVVWIPIISAFPGSQLFNYIQSITAYLAPPICAVFVLAVFVPRVNEPGAFYGLMVGLVIGLTRLIIEFSYKAPDCGEADTRPAILTRVHFLHFGCILFLISSIVTLVVSAFTPKIPREKLFRLTFWTRKSEAPAPEKIELRTSASENLDYGTDRTHQRDEVNSTVLLAETSPSRRKLVVAFLKKLLFLEGTSDNRVPNEAEAERLRTRISLSESKFWFWFCNVQALLLMCFAVGVYIYFK